LRDALDRNCPAVLSVPIDGDLKHSKSRFLGTFEGNILLEDVPQARELIQSAIDASTECGVAFKSGIHKIAFISPILQTLTDFAINESLTANALLVAYPPRVKSLQRRADFRARVTLSSGIRARVWKLPPKTFYRDPPQRTAEVMCEVRDLSVGGMGVRFLPKGKNPPEINVEDRLRVELVVDEQTLLMEGRMREGRPGNDPMILNAGIVFKKTGMDVEGRQAYTQLARIVGALQREELRQFQLGLAA
jgi:c-di-GMP-binding flagellar brake protein YcgR